MLTLSYPGRYWINYGSTSGGFFYGVSHYDKNSIYSAGEIGANLIIKKTDIAGNCQWVRQFGDGINDTTSFNNAVDSSGNLYVLSTTYYTTDRDFHILKYNSSGVLQWKKTLDASGKNASGGIAIDSSDNIYVCGETDQYGEGDIDLLVIKLDSSANIIWQKTLGTAGTEGSFGGVAVDSGGNVIVTGYNSDDVLVAKYNSSGVLQWQRKFGAVKVDSLDIEYPVNVAVDSNDNIYIAGYESDQSGISYYYAGILVKYNSSGVIQWQKRAVKSDSLPYSRRTFFYGITIDSADNIYVAGPSYENRSNIPDLYPLYIAKLNTSGSVIWERILYRGYERTGGQCISIDEYGDLCIVGDAYETASTYYPFMFKVPSDGSLEGSYGSFVYESDSLTWSDSTYTDSATSFTVGISSFSFTDSSLTESAYSCSDFDTIIRIDATNDSLTIAVQENIVTEGLSLHLDARSGFGTDLSGNSNIPSLSGNIYDGESYQLTTSSANTLSGTNLNLTGGQFTLESWIYYGGNSLTGSYGQIFTQDNGAGDGQGWQWRVSNSNKQIEFIYWTSSSRSSAVGFSYVTPLVSGNWYHLVILYDGTNIKGYINGSLDVTHTPSSTLYGSTATIGIGRFNSLLLGDILNGKIAVIRGYKNYYLSDEQIESNYTNQKGRFFGQNNLTINLNI